MFRLIAIDFSQKSPHFSLLSPTSPCELSEREVTSPFNLKVVGACSDSCINGPDLFVQMLMSVLYFCFSFRFHHQKQKDLCNLQASTLAYFSTCPILGARAVPEYKLKLYTRSTNLYLY
jgi:hypothetical protein